MNWGTLRLRSVLNGGQAGQGKRQDADVMQQCVGLLGHRGTNFTFVTKLAFNGKIATFTINSDTQTLTSVPAGASPGKISATSPGGTSTSVSNFTVTPKGLAAIYPPPAGSAGTRAEQSRP